MAQWRGQFSGRTHETRVKGAEVALKHAVEELHAASEPREREKTAKNVRHLATKLLQARLRAFKARLARASEPRMTGQPSGWNDGVDHLRAQEDATRVGGVHGILVEFGAEVAAVPTVSSGSANPASG